MNEFQNPEDVAFLQPTGMEMGLLSIGGILGLVGFICWIMIVVNMFKNNQTGLGIATIVTVFCAGIGYLVALIFGWKNSTAWNIKKVMMAYTVCLIGSVVLTGGGYLSWGARVAREAGRQMQEAGAEMQQGLNDMQDDLEGIEIEQQPPGGNE